MIAVLLICMFLAMIIFQKGYKKLWAKELSVEISFKQLYAYAGDWIQLTEKIENRKRMPVSPMEVRFRMKKGIQFRETENTSISDYVYKRDIYSLLGNQRITRTLHMHCQKRGIYTIDDVSAVTYSLLQDRVYKKNPHIDAKLYVYAKRTDVSAILRTCENLFGEQESNRKYLEDPFAFSSIREYTMQDPMKNINWKASAKTGEWMVNTYTSMKNERMMIYLDVEDSGIFKKEHLKEDSISVAATLFQKLLNKGTEVGICVNLYDEERKQILYLPASRKKSQRTMIEQTLAEEWQEEKVQRVEEFLGNKAKAVWVVTYEKGECPAACSDRILFVKREVAR